jgi:putative type I restriction enzyme specificity protein HI_0216
MSKLDEMIRELCPDGVEYVKLGTLCSLITKQTGFDYTNHIKARLLMEPAENAVPYIQTKFFGGKNFNYQTDYYVPMDIVEQFPKITLDEKCILFSIVGASIGNVGLFPGERKCFLGGAICVAKVLPQYDVDYVYYCVESHNVQHQIRRKTKGAGQATITVEDIREFEIPLPPIEIQSEIVHTLDNYTENVVKLQNQLTAELTARQKQYTFYRNKLLTFSGNEKAKIVKISLGDIGPICMCKRILKSQTNTVEGVPFYKIGTFGKKADAYISKETFDEYQSKYNFPKKGDVLISAAGTIGRTVVYDGEPAYFQDSNIVWIDNDESIVLNSYLRYCYELKPWKVSSGGTIQRLYNDNIAKAVIAVPPIEEQKRIVSILDRFDAISNDLTSGLPAEIEARQKQYEYYRDKLLTFKEVAAT